MNDTTITIVGNVATKPERRRIESTGDTVVSFRVASTSRRFDKASGVWVDGNTFFVRVSCWRSLADNAYQSLFKGDPVVVQGRIWTREYEGEDGAKRSTQELEASALGHNLSRGISTFVRSRPSRQAGAFVDLESSGTPVADPVVAVSGTRTAGDFASLDPRSESGVDAPTGDTSHAGLEIDEWVEIPESEHGQPGEPVGAGAAHRG